MSKPDPPMKHFLIASIACLSLHADEPGKLVFSDDFNRNESQETQDEPGNGWETNSKARAKYLFQLVELREKMGMAPMSDRALGKEVK